MRNTFQDRPFIEFSNVKGLDDSITNVDYFSSADGEDGDEEMTEYESEETEVEGGVEQSDLPRYRDLVRAKKLELKAQYGKGHFDNQSTTTRQCKNVPYPCPTLRQPLKICYKEVCINVPQIKVVWIAGWRRRWNEFKRAGGLAQLKQQAKGTAPIPSPSVLPNTKPSVRPRALALNEMSLVSVPKGIPVVKTEESSNNSTSTESQSTSNEPKSKEAVGKSVTTDAAKTESTTDTSAEKKFLGMPKNIGIAVTIVGVAAIGFVAFKMLNKK